MSDVATATSEFACPDFIEAGLAYLASEIVRVQENVTQQNYEPPTENVAREYSTDAFEMRSYFWGDCQCGWDDKDFDEPHDADCYQHAANRLDEQFHGDPFSKQYDEALTALAAKWGLPEQGCRVHCTCTHRDRFKKWIEREAIGPEGHAPTCPVVRPNFKCGDFEVRWYKYLGRGMSMNREIDANEFFALMDRCLKSVRARDEEPAA